MSHFLDILIKSSDQGACENSSMDLESMGDINLNSEIMSSDFFDNVMSMERESLSTSLDNDLNGFLADPDSSLTDGSYFDVLSHTDTHSYGDGLSGTDGLSHSDGLSHTDGLLSPGSLSVEGDCLNLNNDLDFNSLDDYYSNNINVMEEDEPILSNDNAKRVIPILRKDSICAEDINMNNNVAFIKQETPTIAAEQLSPVQNSKVILRHSNPKRIIIANKPSTNQPGSRNRRQVLRVQSLNGNGKSVLLPLNVKNMKKIRIVNTADMKLENFKTSSVSHQIKKNPVEMYAISSPESVHEEMEQETSPNSRYPPLNLTSEEKRLLLKEGITLPSHYPLTKNEEKELKRIRRKIRNKISAQDSRKRKKEYVDKLEEKAKRTSEENEFLKRKIKMLHKQNSKLMEQMKKLQSLLFNTTSSKATPTTCLMIVLFSTLLVCLPNLKLSDKTDVGEQQHVAARRALLFKQGANEDEVNMDDFLVFNKDDERELESYEDEVAENENNTESGFVKFLEELSKKYEHPPDEKNCSKKDGQGNLFEFCNKYQDDIKGVINNMKSFFEQENSFENMQPPQKKFIEPDISDDEDGITIGTLAKRKSDDVDEWVAKKGKVDYYDEAMYKEVVHPAGPIMDNVISTTVESIMLSTKKK